jgi:hypothetical protein
MSKMRIDMKIGTFNIRTKGNSFANKDLKRHGPRNQAMKESSQKKAKGPIDRIDPFAYEATEFNYRAKNSCPGTVDQ